MTRITTDPALPIEILLVDGEHHLHHFSRGLFGLLVILLESVMNVAELALDSERSGDELHGRKQIVGGNVLQYLHILECFPSCPVFLFGGLQGRRQAQRG